jgi:hypothetical protein
MIDKKKVRVIKIQWHINMPPRFIGIFLKYLKNISNDYAIAKRPYILIVNIIKIIKLRS